MQQEPSSFDLRCVGIDEDFVKVAFEVVAIDHIGDRRGGVRMAREGEPLQFGVGRHGGDRRREDFIQGFERSLRRRLDAHDRGVQPLVDVLAKGEEAAAEPDQNEERAGEKPDPAMEAQEELARGRAKSREGEWERETLLELALGHSFDHPCVEGWRRVAGALTGFECVR